MQPSVPLSREIVLIGGGHTHALLLRAWGMKPLPGARLTVINPDPTAPYTGMLPGFVAGHYPRDALEIDLVKLARFANARLIFGRVSAIDRDAKRLTVAGRPDIAYDIASLDIGITSNMPKLPGFTEHGIAAKPLGPFATRWQAHLDGTAGDCAVIGGGVAGVELALAMQHALGSRGAVAVIEAATALQGIGDQTRARLLDALDKANIRLLEHTTVTQVHADHIDLSSGETIPATLTVGAAGARPFDWLTETGLALTKGFVTVDNTLRSVTDPNIFAVGDCAHLSHNPRPKAGVFAVRAAPTLTANLKAAASDTPLKRFKPQGHYLKLISLGGKDALADKWNRSVGGAWAWTWKDRIDRAFMDRLNNLPAMTPKPPKHHAAGAVTDTPLCGGCGAKVGASVLDAMTGELPHSDLTLGPGDDAALLKTGGATQALTTDHLRAFWNDPWLMGRIAAIHAMGDIWAMGATPQAALAHITLPQMTEPLQRDWLREIMAAAASVFGGDGALIAGGHTTLGMELTLGFTVTGLTETPVTQEGAQPGDVLLLTRAIGSGTLLAAEMATRANGPDIRTALDTMAKSQSDAAQHLAPVANAMTDVTGFGLAGHALLMARASNLSITIDTGAVPFYSGAETLAAQSIRSSLWQSNRDLLTGDIPNTPQATLMFDPQTAGGLLAALPKAQAEAALTALQNMGHRAAIIGEIGPASTTSLTLT
ncbi:MAG: selenide, water dikinase SelD [Pseudomonadota bacterium]